MCNLTNVLIYGLSSSTAAVGFCNKKREAERRGFPAFCRLAPVKGARIKTGIDSHEIPPDSLSINGFLGQSLPLRALSVDFVLQGT